jgi:hypothetical protein
LRAQALVVAQRDGPEPVEQLDAGVGQLDALAAAVVLLAPAADQPLALPSR